jgi:hypothetical protein
MVEGNGRPVAGDETAAALLLALDGAAGVPIAIDPVRLRTIPQLAIDGDQLTAAFDELADVTGTTWRRTADLVAFSPHWYAGPTPQPDLPLMDLVAPPVTLAEERAADFLESLDAEQLGELSDTGWIDWAHLTKQQEALCEVFQDFVRPRPSQGPGATRLAIKFGLSAVVRVNSREHRVALWWDRPAAARHPLSYSSGEDRPATKVVGELPPFVLHHVSLADLAGVAQERFGRRYRVDGRYAGRQVVLTRSPREFSPDALHRMLTEPLGLVAHPIGDHMTLAPALDGAQRLLLYHGFLRPAKRWLGGAVAVVSADRLVEKWQAWPTLPPEAQHKLRIALHARARRPTAPDIPLLRLLDQPEGLQAAIVRFDLLLELEATNPEGQRRGVHFRPARDRLGGR